jgi:hypothetical protein
MVFFGLNKPLAEKAGRRVKLLVSSPQKQEDRVPGRGLLVD